MAYSLRGRQPSREWPPQELVSPHLGAFAKFRSPSRKTIEIQSTQGLSHAAPIEFLPYVLDDSHSRDCDRAQNRSPASQEKEAPREPAVATRPVAAANQTEYRLEYKFRPNQDVRLLKVFASQMKVQKGGRTDVSSIQSSTERHYRVTSVDKDGSAVLDLTIDNVKIAFSVNGTSQVTYDTRGQDAPPAQFESVRDCIGKHALVRVDTRGRVTEMDNSHSSTLEDRDFLVVLPEKPVRIGDEWFDDYPVRVQGHQGIGSESDSATAVQADSRQQQRGADSRRNRGSERG